jgi:hypothetical protein
VELPLPALDDLPLLGVPPWLPPEDVPEVASNPLTPEPAEFPQAASAIRADEHTPILSRENLMATQCPSRALPYGASFAGSEFAVRVGTLRPYWTTICPLIPSCPDPQ